MQDDRRIRWASYALSERERDEVCAWAARLGKPMSVAVRDLVLAEARRDAAERQARMLYGLPGS